MPRILSAPRKYIQGRNILPNLKDYIDHLGENVFILISQNGYDRFADQLLSSFENKENIKFEIFKGECSKKEINRVMEKVSENNTDVIVAVGGGKILDTGKAVTYYLKNKLVVIPTVASTDAPTSAVSVIYTDDGVVTGHIYLPENPNLVLMDLDVIVNAPTRLFVAGMGDALATKFETRSSLATDHITTNTGKATRAAIALSELSYDILINEGYMAKKAVENKIITKSVEKVIEANTLLSGLGFESGGLGAAHAIHNGFTNLPETSKLYHGEIVAYGTLTQLILENADRKEFYEVMEFCQIVGLPITLEDLNLKDIREEDILIVAETSLKEGSPIYRMPNLINFDDIVAAIITVDQLGKDYRDHIIQ